AIFIEGSVTSSGDLTMTIADSTSVLDIFVSGTIVTHSSFKLGSPNYPALTRLYIGSDKELDIQSGLIVEAEIWAGNEKVIWERNSCLLGSLFAGELQVVSEFKPHHDQGVTRAGDSCPPPPGTGAGSSGAGMPSSGAGMESSGAGGMTTGGSTGSGGGV